jgi:hypothetical protein
MNEKENEKRVISFMKSLGWEWSRGCFYRSGSYLSMRDVTDFLTAYDRAYNKGINHQSRASERRDRMFRETAAKLEKKRIEEAKELLAREA